MTPLLIALAAAAATFGAGAVANSSLDYLVQMHEMSAGSRTTATTMQPAPATSLSLANFDIGKVICIHTPGHAARQTCEGTATQLPPLVPGARAILLPVPVRAYVTVEYVPVEGNLHLAVALDLGGLRIDAAAEAAGREFERQLKLAPRCTFDDADIELWRAGPAYLSIIREPFDGLLFVTPAVQLDFGMQSLADTGRLIAPPSTLAFHPVVTAGDCAF